MKIIPIELDKSVIPKGMYCYTPLSEPCEENGWVFKVKRCPYWECYDKDVHGPLPAEYAPYQEKYDGAYCRFLKVGDWFPNGPYLLWDQVKECGINDDWDEESIEAE